MGGRGTQIGGGVNHCGGVVVRGWGCDGEQVGSSVMHLKIPIHKKNPITLKIQVQAPRIGCVERFFPSTLTPDFSNYNNSCCRTSYWREEEQDNSPQRGAGGGEKEEVG